MNSPGFTAELALSARRTGYGTPPTVLDRVVAEVLPASHGVDVSTGHCGCYIDDWFGLPCICVEYW